VDDLLTIPRTAMRARGPELGPAIVIGLIVGILFVVAALAIRPIENVSVTVDNPSDWRTEVSVRSASSPSWTGLGSVGRGTQIEFQQVPDQGSTWIVRFSYAGQSEEIELDRDALRDAQWTVEVPDSLTQRLAEAEVPATTGSTAPAETVDGSDG
jgi:hypothetical protein